MKTTLVIKKRNRQYEQKVVLPDHNRNEIIILLHKIQDDFKMLDSKMREILNVENLDKEEYGDFILSFK